MCLHNLIDVLWVTIYSSKLEHLGAALMTIMLETQRLKFLKLVVPKMEIVALDLRGSLRVTSVVESIITCAIDEFDRVIWD